MRAGLAAGNSLKRLRFPEDLTTTFSAREQRLLGEIVDLEGLPWLV